MSAELSLKREKKSLKTRMKRYKSYYLMLIPIIILVIIFSYIPMFGIIMAFQDYDILGGFFASKWVGFDNFIKDCDNSEICGRDKKYIVYWRNHMDIRNTAADFAGSDDA